ncbi:pyridoxamine 5'-phosphate oxidase family protein [Granulicoccus phenolivorans]|uniref:pyridoxamine 5'-phosphate oxidase family protein n=1 Tax=Granulicoccus phenolivorans TaxID=266854 RepID=UPI0004007639|nr:pyridoxamine 5'-phosphate oxidase family protein [Granulicoccus phenolivorans]
MSQDSVLSEDECWELLKAQEFGRLAYILSDRIQMVPVNYAVNGQTLVFRTARGSKLAGVMSNAAVVFEVDAIDDGAEVGRSVVLHGVADVLPAEAEPMIEQLGLRPWLDTVKPTLVLITPDELTGRRYDLSRPWRHMIRPEGEGEPRADA